LLPPGSEGETLRHSYKTTTEWTTLFNELESCVKALDPVPDRPLEVKLDFNPTLGLKTPAKVKMDIAKNRLWSDNLMPYIEPPKLTLLSNETDSLLMDFSRYTYIVSGSY